MEDLRILLSGEWNNHSETEEKQGWHWSASSSSDEMGNLYHRGKFPTANVNFISCIWAEPPFCQHPWIIKKSSQYVCDCLHNIFVTTKCECWAHRHWILPPFSGFPLHLFETPPLSTPTPPSSVGENWHMAMVQWAKHQSVCRGYLNMQTSQHCTW